MTGEMSSSEVTPENYPELFRIKELLDKKGIDCDARPFDHYQGPFLYCKGKLRNFKVWYGHSGYPDEFIAEYTKKGRRFTREFIMRKDNLYWLNEIDSKWDWADEQPI